MQSCLRTNAEWQQQPLTPDTKKTREEYREEHKIIRQGKSAFNQMVDRYAHALVACDTNTFSDCFANISSSAKGVKVLNLNNSIPTPHVVGLDE